MKKLKNEFLSNVSPQYQKYLSFNDKGFLTEDSALALINLFQKKNDQRAMKLLLIGHDRFIKKIPKKFKARTPFLDFDDLCQQARIGFIKAVEKYDPQKGAKFTSYAYQWVYAEVQRYCELNRTAVTRPAIIREEDKKLLDAYKNTPFDEELHTSMGASVTEIKALRTLYYSPALSLNSPVSNDSSTTHLELLEGDIIGTEETVERVFQRKYVNLLARKANLDERDTYIIQAHYGVLDGEEKSLAEIGRELGVSRERVRQIESRALKKLAEAARTIEISITKKANEHNGSLKESEHRPSRSPSPQGDGFYAANLEPEV